MSSCLNAAGANIDCSRAVGVTNSYDTCVGEIDAMSCQIFVDAVQNGQQLSLPASCNGVILVQ